MIGEGFAADKARSSLVTYEVEISSARYGERNLSTQSVDVLSHNCWWRCGPRLMTTMHLSAMHSQRRRADSRRSGRVHPIPPGGTPRMTAKSAAERCPRCRPRGDEPSTAYAGYRGTEGTATRRKARSTPRPCWTASSGPLKAGRHRSRSTCSAWNSANRSRGRRSGAPTVIFASANGKSVTAD
jgi:hypothetical protein